MCCSSYVYSWYIQEICKTHIFLDLRRNHQIILWSDYFISYTPMTYRLTKPDYIMLTMSLYYATNNFFQLFFYRYKQKRWILWTFFCILSLFPMSMLVIYTWTIFVSVFCINYKQHDFEQPEPISRWIWLNRMNK